MLPLVFSFLGLGSLSFTAFLAQYRTLFLVLTFAALGISFYLNYIRVRSHIVNRIFFWISLIVAVGVVGWL